jgi:UDP-sulfoquinovose synthase
MNILILGGDGYLGWPTAMRLAKNGHDVTVVDNYLRRTIAEQTDSNPLISTPNLTRRVEVFRNLTDKNINFKIGDLSDPEFTFAVFKDAMPETIIHYAEQPSAPYSMLGFKQAKQTLDNNLQTTLNCIWATQEIVPDAHIIKLGTMGEYGTPNIDIEEGWIDINHKGRTEKFLYPRAAGSLYHTTKILDTDLLWFYVRTHDLRVTDLMQGPVYGLSTSETELSDELLPNFHYDDIFGTVVNRFVTQAVIGSPLTVFGKGGQTRGYLNLKDTLQCVELATLNKPKKGELRILNQFTETFTVNQLAERVQQAGKDLGLSVSIKSIQNPRKEKEEHYYNPAHSGLLDLGLKPTFMTDEVLKGLMSKIMQYKQNIDPYKIQPRSGWNKS